MSRISSQPTRHSRTALWCSTLAGTTSSRSRTWHPSAAWQKISTSSEAFPGQDKQGKPALRSGLSRRCRGPKPPVATMSEKNERYSGDTTDEDRAVLFPPLPNSNRTRRPRDVVPRDVRDAIGCAAFGCTSFLPKDFPRVSTVRYNVCSLRNSLQFV